MSAFRHHQPEIPKNSLLAFTKEHACWQDAPSYESLQEVLPMLFVQIHFTQEPRRHNATCHFTLLITRTACALQKYLMKTEELQKKEIAESTTKKCIYIVVLNTFFFFFSQVRNHSMIKINHSTSNLTSTQQPGAYRRRDFSLFTNP